MVTCFTKLQLVVKIRHLAEMVFFHFFTNFNTKPPPCAIFIFNC